MAEPATPHGTTVIQCFECCRQWQVPLERRRICLTDDDPPVLVAYCPDCGKREFGASPGFFTFEMGTSSSMGLVKQGAKWTLAVVDIGITQAPRCAHCGRDDVEFVTFELPDNDHRDFVVEPGPVCIDCPPSRSS